MIRVMGLEPFALSVHHFISSVGADAGFASIIGLAVLVLLYFAQARETASLRDQAELAAQRVAQLEHRLAHAVTGQPRAVAVAAPPPGAQPPRVVPAAAANQPAPAIATAGIPWAPAGVAAPALTAAAKLIPTLPVQPPEIGAVGVAAARISAPAGVRTPVAAAATGAPPAPPGVPPAPPGVPPLSSAPESPPAVNKIVTPRPATAAGGANATNATTGTGEHAAVKPPTPMPPRQPDRLPPRPPVAGSPGGAAPGRGAILGGLAGGGDPRTPSRLVRAVIGLASLAILAVIVILLVSLTGGTSHSASHTSARTTNSPRSHRTGATKPAAVNDASVTVAVLNGTPVYHLANGVATRLGAEGFKKGTIANAADQTQSTTSVQYLPGAQRDAAAVAKALKLGASSVQPIAADTQALACPQTTPCNADVVVTVGSALTNTQTQTTP